MKPRLPNTALHYATPEHIHATCNDYRAGATYDLAADEADRAAGQEDRLPDAGPVGRRRAFPARPMDRSRPWQRVVRRTSRATASTPVISSPRKIREACWPQLLPFLERPWRIDRQQAFSGTHGSRSFRLRRWKTICAAHRRGFAGPLAISALQGRAIESDLQALDAVAATMCCARKPSGKLLPSAHAIEREYRVTRRSMRRAFRWRGRIVLCTDESVIGTRLLCDGFRRRAGCSGSRMRRASTARTGRICSIAERTLARCTRADSPAA